MTVLSVLFLTMARIIPILTMAPFLGAKNLPNTVKIMFSIALAILFVPQNLLLIHGDIPPESAIFFGYMAKELLIGSVLGILASVPFFIAQSAGSIIDHSRGSSALQVTDPTTQSQTGPIGQLYNYVLITVFFSLGGPFLFFEALARSYQIVPVDGFIGSSFFHASVPFWKHILSLLQQIMNLALQISAPALIGTFLTDLFLGIANRLAPQVQIVFLGISLKSWVGIALLTAAWGLIIQVMGKESIVWIKTLQKYISQGLP